MAGEGRQGPPPARGGSRAGAQAAAGTAGAALQGREAGRTGRAPSAGSADHGHLWAERRGLSTPGPPHRHSYWCHPHLGQGHPLGRPGLGASLACSTPVLGAGQPSSSVTPGRGASAVVTLLSRPLLGRPALPGKPLGSEAGPPPRPHRPLFSGTCVSQGHPPGVGKHPKGVGDGRQRGDRNPKAKSAARMGRGGSPLPSVGLAGGRGEGQLGGAQCGHSIGPPGTLQEPPTRSSTGPQGGTGTFLGPAPPPPHV